MASNNLLSGFTCQDFLPKCCESEGIFTKPVYEPFSMLIVRANEWLRANPKWKVTTCESIEFKYKGEDMNFNKMTFLEYGERKTKYIRGLRLWVTELQNVQDRAQQIGYLNLTPQCLKRGGIFTTPEFETLDVVLGKFNSTIRMNPLPGKVITVESQEMKIKIFDEFDPDRTYWIERGDINTRFLFVIRVFYEISSPNPEEIGLADFIPDKLASGGVFTNPKYELFSNLVEKASNWCAHQYSIRVCNVQSVELKKKPGREVNTLKMAYVEHGNMRTHYVRILRVAYVKSCNLYPDSDALLASRLVCTTFVPEEIEKHLFSSKYEGFTTVKEKISAWVKATGSRVLSAETAALRMYTGGEARYGTEACYTYNTSERNEYWIFVIRLYLNVVT